MSYSDAALLLQLSEVTAERDAAVRRAERAEAKLLELVEEVAELKARCSALREKLRKTTEELGAALGARLCS